LKKQALIILKVQLRKVKLSEHKFIVAGAGFSGAVITERIANELNEKVLIYEKRDHLGGNAYDFVNKNGIIIHKYGPHIFHTFSKKVWNYISRFTEWFEYKHRVLAKVDDKLIPLPFDFKSLEILLTDKSAKIKETLLKTYGENKKTPVYELLNSNKKILKEFGEFVFEKIFFNYSKKQWGVNPLSLSKEVLKRVPVFIGYTNSYFDDPYYGIPKDGFTRIFNKMLDNKNIKILLKKDFKEDFRIKDNRVFFKGKKFDGIIIYTGEIDYLFDRKFGKLPYRSLKFEFEDCNLKEFQPVAVVNYPGKEKFTRITEYKHFLNQKVKKTTISKEYPGEYTPNKKNFNIPYYPILSKENEELFEKYVKEAKEIKNIFLVGRLAEYRYYNMDDAILRALETFEKIKSLWFYR